MTKAIGKRGFRAENYLKTPSGNCPKVFACSSVSFRGSRMLLTHFSNSDYTLLDYASFRRCGPKAFKDDLWDFNHLQTPSGNCPKVFACSSVSFRGSRMLLTHFSNDAGNDAGNRKNGFLGR